jgi:hypothetical protein
MSRPVIRLKGYCNIDLSKQRNDFDAKAPHDGGSGGGITLAVQTAPAPQVGIFLNAIAKRFQLLIAATSKVRSTISSSLKCGLTAFHTLSGT